MKLDSKYKYAHYFRAGNKQYLILSETNRPTGKYYAVGNKRAANNYCKNMNLIAWNF